MDERGAVKGQVLAHRKGAVNVHNAVAYGIHIQFDVEGVVIPSLAYVIPGDLDVTEKVGGTPEIAFHIAVDAHTVIVVLRDDDVVSDQHRGVHGCRGVVALSVDVPLHIDPIVESPGTTI